MQREVFASLVGGSVVFPPATKRKTKLKNRCLQMWTEKNARVQAPPL
jgi:hypothetical protein